MHILQCDAIDQAAAIARGEISARDLVAASIAQIAARDGVINAVVWKRFEAALEEAETPIAGPLSGVPILLKDLMGELAGAPMTAGSRSLRNNIAKEDCEFVRRMRAAGAIILGRTGASEFGLVPTTEPLGTGPVRNPHDATRMAGGSSGGSAAAVAANYVAIAHGTDGGGSLRIPASCCGVVGMKPSRGRTSLGPRRGDVLMGLVGEHVITRSVRDSALVLDITSGYVPGDPYDAVHETRSFISATTSSTPRLRIGMGTTSPLGGSVDPICKKAAHEAAARLAEQGCIVEEAAPVIPAEQLVQAFTVLWLASAAENVASISAFAPNVPPSMMFEPTTLLLAELGARFSGIDVVRAVETLQRIARGVAPFFARYDLWLTPTLAEPPLPLGEFSAEKLGREAALSRGFAFTPFTILANAAGLPSISVPMLTTEAGLPVGAMLTGGFGRDWEVFAGAQALNKTA